MSYDNISNWLSVTFAMLNHIPALTLADIENMKPWERKSYLILLKTKIENEEEELRKFRSSQKNGGHFSFH
jgi:hypothetical protein